MIEHSRQNRQNSSALWSSSTDSTFDARSRPKQTACFPLTFFSETGTAVQPVHQDRVPSWTIPILIEIVLLGERVKSRSLLVDNIIPSHRLKQNPCPEGLNHQILIWEFEEKIKSNLFNLFLIHFPGEIIFEKKG